MTNGDVSPEEKKHEMEKHEDASAGENHRYMQQRNSVSFPSYDEILQDEANLNSPRMIHYLFCHLSASKVQESPWVSHFPEERFAAVLI